MMILDDSREQWWNADHLDLIARRLDLATIKSLVDAGCGRGHWTRLLEPRLAPAASIIGVDLDAAHVRSASAWFASARPSANVEFRVGDALALPVVDNAVDAATCQTLLMHLDDPARGLAELVRVVRPGGLVFCSEPQNILSLLRWSDAMLERDPADVAAVFELWLRVQRGKRGMGLGDVTVGDRLPSLFANAGLVDIQVWQSDRAFSIRPPYRAEELQLFAADARARKRGVGAWDEERLRSRFVAGGGDEVTFTATFARMKQWADDDEKRVATERYATTYGDGLFLAAGRKP